VNVLLIAIALIGPVLGAVFATHAGWSWASTQYSPWVASALVGAFYACLGSIAAATLLWKAKASKPPAQTPTSSASPLALVETAMKRKPLQTTAALMGLGALLARKPKLALSALSKFAASS
tara:strand:- start:293 stop:655 length:363 start_codon:yes stop_codon:yes gene_type:complete